MLMLYLILLGNGYVSDRLFYGQTSTYHYRHMNYVTLLVFVHRYICAELANSYGIVRFCVIETIFIGVTEIVWIGVSSALAHLCTIL